MNYTIFEGLSKEEFIFLYGHLGSLRKTENRTKSLGRNPFLVIHYRVFN